MSYSPLTDQQSGRVSTWGATKTAAYVVLINPTTGLPYVASGGGSGGSGIPVTDANGNRWLWYYDATTSTSTYISFATQTPGTPVQPIVPDADATVAVSNFPATQAVTGPLTDTQLRATAVPVSGPLTDTQLRATPVPVSGTVTANTGLSQPLTDTQLRATPVPVSGTVTANTGLSQPLTDTQLRATAVPVSGTFFQATQPVSAASLPLPTGAASETTLSALNTKIPSQVISGLLPVDTLGTPGTPRVQATSAAAASIALTSTCRRFSMYATTGTWYSISGTATATSHYIAAGERLDLDCPASTTVSVLRETTDGSIRITELV